MGRKGIVVEQGENEITVLFDNGSYKKIKTNRPLYVGEIYESDIRYSSRLIATAAIFILCIIVGIDFFTVTAQAELSSGINLGINRWNKVVTVETENEEAQKVITGLAIKGSNYDKVIPKIIEKSIVENKSEIQPVLRIEVKAKNKAVETDLQKQFVKSLQKAKGDQSKNNSNNKGSRNNKGQSNNNNNNNNKTTPSSNNDSENKQSSNQKLKNNPSNSQRPNQSIKDENKPSKEKPKINDNSESSKNNNKAPQNYKKEKNNVNNKAQSKVKSNGNNKESSRNGNSH